MGACLRGGVWGDVRHYIYKHKKATDGVFWALPLGCQLSPVTPQPHQRSKYYFIFKLCVCDRGVNIKRSCARYTPVTTRRRVLFSNESASEPRQPDDRLKSLTQVTTARRGDLALAAQSSVNLNARAHSTVSRARDHGQRTGVWAGTGTGSRAGGFRARYGVVFASV